MCGRLSGNPVRTVRRSLNMDRWSFSNRWPAHSSAFVVTPSTSSEFLLLLWVIWFGPVTVLP